MAPPAACSFRRDSRCRSRVHGGFAFAVEPLWRQAFWFSYFAWIAIEIAIWSRDFSRVKGTRNDRFSMLAIGVSIGIGITLAFNAPRLASACRDGPDVPA